MLHIFESFLNHFFKLSLLRKRHNSFRGLEAFLIQSQLQSTSSIKKYQSIVFTPQKMYTLKMGQTKHPHVDAQNCGNGKKIDSNNQEQKHAFCFPTKKCSGECANNFNFLDWGAARLDPICKSPKVRSTSAHTYEYLCVCLTERRPRVCHCASIAGLGQTIFYDEFTKSLNWTTLIV